MARLTKSEIEQNLLVGKSVEWKDANGKKASIVLDSPDKRRLFAYVLSSSVRDVKGIPDDCVKGLSTAFLATDDPATQQVVNKGTVAKTGPWKLHSIKAEGFGGVNAWNGKPFELEIEGSSYLLEGPNGSGKSSFASAIIWALCGERPRDQAESSSDESKPVFNTKNSKAGDWPPVATYPEDLSGILSGPKVSVELTFTNLSGASAAVRRVFDGGKITHDVDPQLNIPPILLETGLLMPSRLPKLRLDEGRGKLTDAVQKLTGLDELVELGVFIVGLCNSGRDYLKYIKSELQSAKISFDKQVALAKSALEKVGIDVPDFGIEDTDDPSGAMAKFGKEQVEKASDLSNVVSNDLATGLDLSDSQTQKKIRFALAGADEDIKLGLAGLQQWKSFEAIANALPAKKLQEMADAVAHAKASLASAIEYHNKAISDTRYRLKAAAARWHAEHGSGLIEDCPACMQSLKEKPEFQAELTELQNAGEAATRKLSDNVNAILAELENTVPQTMRRYLSESVSVEPRADLVRDFEMTFVIADRYQNYLSKCGELSKSALKIAPSAEMEAPSEEEQTAPETETVFTRISRMEKLSSLATWFDTERAQWLEWWKDLSTASLLPDGTTPVSKPETLSAHLSRISKALEDTEPYSLGAEAMREAWKQGVAARKIEQEFEQRQAIADALAPLKELGKLAEAQARDTLNELSAKIGKIHKANYLSDSLKFESTKLERKEGLVVRGQLGDEICIDATLVANTSWLRGVLWAFIFALREEAVEQIGSDNFPIMVLDDPQQTFDTIHRHRWAEYIASLQSKTPGVQIILASFDEQFLTLLGVDGVTGRRALIASAGPEMGHIGVFEGDALDRQWQRVEKEKTQKAAQEYMAAVRVHVEGMLQLMLRGEDVDASSFDLGASREKLTILHNRKHEPWAQKVFASLVNKLGKNVREIQFIQIAHHPSGAHLGMTEATDVESHWEKSLRPLLEKAFRIVREHRALHGGLAALHALPPTVSLPEGRKSAVSAIEMRLVGSAAALTDGKVADGCVDLQIDEQTKDTIHLKSNVIYRLTTPTLEPVARSGDLLLVSEFKIPTANSLVVARCEDRLLARRLEIADNHSDVAVLSANAINPRMIAAPTVAKLSTLTIQKIIGVLYDHGKSVLGSATNDEVCDCGGDAYVKAAFIDMQGLIEVEGHSAEPHALHKQFLIISNPIYTLEASKKLEGHPVIAEDSSGDRYFKRLRSGGDGLIILESLEIGGGFSPIVLADKPGSQPHVQTIWPVLGVLFERPS